MKQLIDLSVIIVSYNTKELTLACIETVLNSVCDPYKIEVLVVDNASTDGTVEEIRSTYPSALCIKNRTNVGFSKANNRGIEVAHGRYVLLLNSDTEVPGNTLKDLIVYMDKHADVGATTGKLLLENGTMDPACHRGIPTLWASFTYVSKLEYFFPRSKLFGQYHQYYKDLTTIHEVDCISGAFYMVRREAIEAVGILDESFFMYGEDVDWSYRIRKAGWKIIFNPTVTVLHRKKQSGRHHKNRLQRVETDKYFHENNLRFYMKHFAQQHPWIIRQLIRKVFAFRIFLLQKFAV